MAGTPKGGFRWIPTGVQTVSSPRRFAGITVALGVGTFLHGVLTWPTRATIALFGVGAVIAFVAEAVVIHLRWLEHHIDPKVLGVPLYLLAGWPAVIYLAFRIAHLGATGLPAVFLAAALATIYDLFTDHQGVESGHWTYTDDLPGPRFRGVPWWNVGGWLLISAITAAAALPFL